MPQQLIFTSVPEGLQPGSRGFTTVACSRTLSPPMVSRLESLSVYKSAYGLGDPNARLNPVLYAYRKLQQANGWLPVLTRSAPAGTDYSGRSNTFTHHILPAAQECGPAGPAWVCQQPGVFHSVWDGRPRHIQDDELPLPIVDHHPEVCRTWEAVTGDAGWGGALAAAHYNAPTTPVYVIYRPGTDVLKLITESVAILPADQRWQATFNTYWTGARQDIACRWRCVLAGGPGHAAVPRNAERIDLTQPMPKPPAGPATDAARAGLIWDKHTGIQRPTPTGGRPAVPTNRGRSSIDTFDLDLAGLDEPSRPPARPANAPPPLSGAGSHRGQGPSKPIWKTPWPYVTGASSVVAITALVVALGASSGNDPADTQGDQQTNPLDEGAVARAQTTPATPAQPSTIQPTRPTTPPVNTQNPGVGNPSNPSTNTTQTDTTASTSPSTTSQTPTTEPGIGTAPATNSQGTTAPTTSPNTSPNSQPTQPMETVANPPVENTAPAVATNPGVRPITSPSTATNTTTQPTQDMQNLAPNLAAWDQVALTGAPSTEWAKLKQHANTEQSIYRLEVDQAGQADLGATGELRFAFYLPGDPFISHRLLDGGTTLSVIATDLPRLDRQLGDFHFKHDPATGRIHAQFTPGNPDATERLAGLRVGLMDAANRLILLSLVPSENTTAQTEPLVIGPLRQIVPVVETLPHQTLKWDLADGSGDEPAPRVDANGRIRFGDGCYIELAKRPMISRDPQTPNAAWFIRTELGELEQLRKPATAEAFNELLDEFAEAVAGIQALEVVDDLGQVVSRQPVVFDTQRDFKLKIDPRRARQQQNNDNATTPRFGNSLNLNN